MRYEHPNVEMLASATAMVQSLTKLVQNVPDNIIQGDSRYTDGQSYQSDE